MCAEGKELTEVARQCAVAPMSLNVAVASTECYVMCDVVSTMLAALSAARMCLQYCSCYISVYFT